MTWFGWVFVILAIVNAVLAIGCIGRPREPITPAVAIGTLLGNGLLVWGAATVGTVQ